MIQEHTTAGPQPPIIPPAPRTALEYEAPQTRLLGRYRPPPPGSGTRLLAAGGVVLCGVVALFASRGPGDIAEAFGAGTMLVGGLVFLTEFCLVWAKRPR